MHVAEVSGVSNVLQVRASVSHDWQGTAAVMATQAWWLQAFRADDVAANVREELAAQRTAGLDDAARQQAWIVLGRQEARLLAERAVLQELERLVAQRAVLWDPRLDEVATITATLRQFWDEVAPALPKEALIARGLAPLATLVEAVLAQSRLTQPSADLVAARELVGSLESRWFTMQVVWHRVVPLCIAVRDHCGRCAAHTKVEDLRRVYTEMAEQCDRVVAVVEKLREN